MRKPSAGHFRQSQQPANAIVENLPDLYPTEEWRAFYWTLEPDGNLATAHAVMHLPQGTHRVTPRVSIGEAGIIEHVRRWGVTLRGAFVQEIDLDLDALLTHDRARFSSDDAEALAGAVDAGQRLARGPQAFARGLVGGRLAAGKPQRRCTRQRAQRETGEMPGNHADGSRGLGSNGRRRRRCATRRGSASSGDDVGRSR